MSDQATLYLCISAPICLVIIAFIFRKRKIHAKGTLPDGSSLTLGEPSEGEIERARNRIPLSLDEMDYVVEQFVQRIPAALTHGCVQRDLLVSLTDGHQTTNEVIIDVLEDAKEQGRNGRISRGIEKMKKHDAEFREMVSRRLVV